MSTGTGGDFVLIVAKEDDAHARKVVGLLEANHSMEAVFCDTGTFPHHMSVAAGIENSCLWLELAMPGRRIELDRVRSIWWRRPQPLEVDARIQAPEVRSFTFHECISGLYGILRCCGTPLWVNDLDRDSAAEYKPIQLKVASELGFAIPETLITNEPDLAMQFWQFHDRNVVYKAFNQRGVIWTPTRRLMEQDLGVLENLRLAQAIFQRHVDGVRDLRVTVVGDQVFATEFDIEGMDATDYRVKMQEIPIRPHNLPAEFEERIRIYMKRLGLEYGALDFRLTAHDEYVFFEINTAGEFLYVEDRTGQAIAAAVASHLAGGKPANAPQPSLAVSA